MQKSRITAPPMKTSDEATKKQLRLAIAQGDAFQVALDYMISEEAHGAEKKAGEYLVGYAVEHAEGMYHQNDGELMWENPGEENAHVEISVRDGADGRFIPGLKLYVTILDSQGKNLGKHEQPFLWHPWLFHYGRNWKLPGDGNYSLQIHIEPPDFMRHDKKNGLRYKEAVDVEFKNVRIETGQKIS